MSSPLLNSSSAVSGTKTSRETVPTDSTSVKAVTHPAAAAGGAGADATAPAAKRTKSSAGDAGRMVGGGAASSVLSPRMVVKKETFTITFGDCAENHVRMQKLGKAADSGFSLADLHTAKAWFEARGVSVEIVHLNPSLPEGTSSDADAYILVAKAGLTAICDPHAFHSEQAALDKDKQALMYGRVVEKRARHNLCFAETSQEPDIAAGKGTVVAFADVPLLLAVRSKLSDIVGAKAEGLFAEGNYYYNIAECGIGFHGDTERRRVIGIRTGADMPLVYHWFHGSKPIGRPCTLTLGHGDVYIMSDKAVGYDWRKPSLVTLRHAAGAKKFTTVPAS